MARKPYFNSVDAQVDFPKLEKELLDHWYKKGIVKKYLNRNKKSKKYFSFMDGPITANNPMGVHHAWGRTYKDLWMRFKNNVSVKLVLSKVIGFIIKNNCRLYLSTSLNLTF